MSGAARHDLYVHLGGERHDAAHLFHGLGQHGDQGELPVHCKGIALIGAKLGFLVDDALGWQDAAKRGGQLLPVVEDRILGFWHHKRHDALHSPFCLLRLRVTKSSRLSGSL